MHDPNTVAFEIKNPFVRVKKDHYRPSLVTIWHRDPEKHGDDDSCGWFKRARHGDKDVLTRIRKDFAFESQYWFGTAGYPVLSVIGTVLAMYHKALWVVYNRDRNKINRFMRRHLVDILYFAENPHDSLSDSITMKFGFEKVDYRTQHLASVIYGDILRRQQKWYQHPRWHIHHWRIQFHLFQDIKRRYWDKCSICGKRGFKTSAHSDYHGTRIWHQECDPAHKYNKPTANEL